uniref:DNA-directed DNA polymerase n=1 Tax=Sicyonia whispovirus TaxID=2984283 RepID=A0A9C7BN75_9VIRU|nr:MAG: wsv514-like protein [Sicyonia whispovirus]
MFFYEKCGYLDRPSNTLVVYNNNSKVRISLDRAPDGLPEDGDRPLGLRHLGVLMGVSDCLVTCADPHSGPKSGGAVKMVSSKSSRLRVESLPWGSLDNVTDPSGRIGGAFARTVATFREAYAAALVTHPHMFVGAENAAQKMAAYAKFSTLPVSTVGVRLRIQLKSPESEGSVSERECVIHNPSGVTAFSNFNSSLVFFEAHTDMDLLMMMVTFLKHNGVWGGPITANMDLAKFDYVGAFFDSEWCSDDLSFTAVRAQMIGSLQRARVAISCSSVPARSYTDCGKRKREADDVDVSHGHVSDYMAASAAAVGCFLPSVCPHGPGLSLRLGAGQEGCVACFSTLFFVPEDAAAAGEDCFVTATDLAGAQRWIEDRLEGGAQTLGADATKIGEALSKLAQLTQAAHALAAEGNPGGVARLGAGGRAWNWPDGDASEKMGEFVTQSTALLLGSAREGDSARLDADAVFSLANPFGKMLLLTIHNCSILTGTGFTDVGLVPRGRATGRWWTTTYVGPALWVVQVTKCEVESGKTIDQLASLETLRRLPLPANRVADDRIVFRAFCRGENLASGAEVVSDVSQSVKEMGLVLENRIYNPDMEQGRMRSAPAVTDPLFSLEVTGFRSNRSMGTANSGKVGARLMRVLGAREGARVWVSERHGCLVLERVNHERELSFEAMERALKHHRVMYYDIETNTKDFTEDSAVITSVCLCTCSGGDLSRGGERVVFGLASPGTNCEELREKILGSYPGFCGGVGGKEGEGNEEYMPTDHAPQVVEIFTNEFEMLLAFGDYVEHRRPHVVSGWNSVAFDDPFVFMRIIRHLTDFRTGSHPVATEDTVASVLPPTGGGSRAWSPTTPAQRLRLASTGLFRDLVQFVDPMTGFLPKNVSELLEAGALSQVQSKFHERSKLSDSTAGSAGWFQNVVGGCCSAIRLDMMLSCTKAYKETLPEFNLNAVLAKVSKVSERYRNVKDEVDLHHHLLGFLKLREAREQAVVHVYCCKDAYLVAVVAVAINKEGEIFRLSLDSALTESVVTTNLVTPLCLGEGAVCRNMGPERSLRRGLGVRRHSMATDTKGGMVSQPLVDHVPFQTIDLNSLYPMLMVQNNLCTSTFVTQRQVIELRDRIVQAEYKCLPEERRCPTALLDIVDACNAVVLGHYRPVDIAVQSWRSGNSDAVGPPTRLERALGTSFYAAAADPWREDAWCADSPPNMNLTAAGLDYFPEVVCSADLQHAAKVNDDMHVAPASLEYMLQVLPLMVVERPHLAAHMTAGVCQTAEECLHLLEKDFDAEQDERVRTNMWTFVGAPQCDFTADPVARAIEDLRRRTCARQTAEQAQSSLRIARLLDRIHRRVAVFNSADDEVVRKWSGRLINVGMFVRTWNAKTKMLPGVIPRMQAEYRSDRIVMQKAAKDSAAAGDAQRAGLFQVGQLTMKLAMNSMYGCLALRAKSSRRLFEASGPQRRCDIVNRFRGGGAGGGTRHLPTANQITENARCVFGNISCALQQALPGTKQAYGDTDSVFCVHNIVGDCALQKSTTGSGKGVYLMDIHLKRKMSDFIPTLVNCLTKGIRYVESRDGGHGMMGIAHERMSVVGFLFAKKTYHMLHFKESSKGFAQLVKLSCSASAEDARAEARKYGTASNVDKFVEFVPRPPEAEGYIVPHNPGLIFEAARSPGGTSLRQFLEREGMTDAQSMATWLSSSPVWIEMDAKTVNDLYASKIVDADSGHWVNHETSRRVECASAAEAVAQADGVFTPYKKGAFVKKGITPTTKLKGLQSLLARMLADPCEAADAYKSTVKIHVKNFASHSTSPALMITSARVQKMDMSVAQNLPNPLSVAINNHLNPSSPIFLGEKFKAVTSVTARALLSPEDLPKGFFNAGCVRWNWQNMKGSVPASAVKNLSVVPNPVTTVYEMMDADRKALSAMVKRVADVLCSAASGTGFSLRRGALSFNTGVLVTTNLAMACLRAPEPGSLNGFFSGVEFAHSPGEDTSSSEGMFSPGYGTPREGASTFPPLASKTDPRRETKQRLLAALASSCINSDEQKRLEGAATGMGLARFVEDFMRVDPRVPAQMEAVMAQLESAKRMCNKKKATGGQYESEIDRLVAVCQVDFFRLLQMAAEHTRAHWKKCQVTAPPPATEGEGKIPPPGGVSFSVTLDAFLGKYKCTNTCDMACTQSLYFVLLTTLALKHENKRREAKLHHGSAGHIAMFADHLAGGSRDMARTAICRVENARMNETVKNAFPRNYNHDTDCLVYLFEPSKVVGSMASSMGAEEITAQIKELSVALATGRIWDPQDRRFFGRVVGRKERTAELAFTAQEQELVFVTGLYHTAAVEIACACLSVIL